MRQDEVASSQLSAFASRVPYLTLLLLSIAVPRIQPCVPHHRADRRQDRAIRGEAARHLPKRESLTLHFWSLLMVARLAGCRSAG